MKLNKYLHRFGKLDSPLCHTCNEAEDVEHYLMRCRSYTQQRNKLFEKLRKEGVQNINLKTLLGGSAVTPSKQKTIQEAVGVYLKESGRLNGFTN